MITAKGSIAASLLAAGGPDSAPSRVATPALLTSCRAMPDASTDRRRTASERPDRHPWRVEGGPERPQEDRPSPRLTLRPPGGRWFWIGLLVLFALNWYVGSRVPEGKTDVEVPYTFFRAQGTQG